jgi:hypothetical protein
MHKKLKPDSNFVSRMINSMFPHCDPRVLHAPGECNYCDKHGEWQALRIAWGVTFTGYEPDIGEVPDPATLNRPVKTIEKWPGNRSYIDIEKHRKNIDIIG